MITVFKVEDLDCAHCALKMEEAVSQIPGITAARMNFMAQKLTVETAEEPSKDLIKKIDKACRKIDRDVRLSQ